MEFDVKARNYSLHLITKNKMKGFLNVKIDLHNCWKSLKSLRGNLKQGNVIGKMQATWVRAAILNMSGMTVLMSLCLWRKEIKVLYINLRSWFRLRKLILLSMRCHGEGLFNKFIKNIRGCHSSPRLIKLQFRPSLMNCVQAC